MPAEKPKEKYMNVGIFTDDEAPPLPGEEPKHKMNGAPKPGETVTFLVSMDCATKGHTPLEDELPMTKNGVPSGVVIKFCTACFIVYWEMQQTVTAAPVPTRTRS